MILVLALVINLLPAQVIALAWPASASGEASASGGEMTAGEDDAVIVSEVTEKRTEFSKEYKLSNGLHMAVLYPEAVHYAQDGQWRDIDNTLRLSGSCYTNTAGVWNVAFPCQLSGGSAVTVAKDGYTLSFYMAGELRGGSGSLETASMNAAVGGETFSVQAVQTASAQIQEIDLSAVKAEAQHPETISDKLQSRLQYADVYGNTDIVYDLNSNQVKESVVMQAYSAGLLGYRYTLNVGNLIPVLTDSNEIYLYDENREEIIMVMPAPFLVDDAGEYCDDVEVTLTGSGSSRTLTYLLPQSWLADSQRQWPVVLDPVVLADLTRSNIRDVGAYQYNRPNDYNAGVLDVGHYSSYGIMRSFLKYATLPELTSADVIVSAELMLENMNTKPNMNAIEIHKVLSTWESETLTWANQPGFDPIVEDYALVQNAGNYYWDITDIVRGWYEGENTGLMLRAPDEIENTTSTDSYRTKFYSSDYSPYHRPVLSIYFRNSNGLESYWDYTSASAGRAGTGYVNNYSGNLTWVRGDIGFGGNRMPVSISHIYNANDSQNNDFGIGYGCRTNFNQLVCQWSQDSSYYVWEDGDGTDHYFKYSSSGTYLDEDGLELTLTTTGSGTTKYKIADKYGNASYFDTSGRLTKIENNQQTKSSILISYQSSDSKLIYKITDGAGRVYNFTYTNSLLNRISYVGKGTTEIAYVSYGYTASRLTSVTDKDGRSSIFTYGANNLLTAAQDIDGYKLVYTYNTTAAGQPSRVATVKEYDGSTLGSELTIEYAHNQTTFTDHNGNVQIMQFNTFGNPVSVQDGQGRAQYAKYARNDDQDTASKGNQLTLSSKMQNTVSNLLSDSSFELGNAWDVNTNTVTMSRTTATSYLGSHSLKVTSTAEGGTYGVYSPYVFVAPGETITFSAYVKSSGTPVQLAFHCLYEGYNFLVLGEELLTPEEWTRMEVSYTNDQDITLRMVGYLFNKTAGVSYIDCAQIEIQPTASRYNLIENGDFSGTTGWSSGSGRTTLTDIAAPQLDGNVYRMTGSPTSAISISQTVNVSGVKDDTYVFGGWAKGDSVPLKDGNRSFGIKLTFHYTDGTTSAETVSFNTACDSRDSWQYVSAPAVAQKAYSSITVQLSYDYNANTVYFDGIQLFREEFGTSYGYDEDGNLTSVVDLQKQVTDYEYTNNNLTKILQDNKAKVTYTYDGYHNVQTATTQEGLVYEFVYDTYGNNTSVSIGSGSTKITATATYSTDGNILLSTKDALDKTTTYGYNENTNVLEWVQYPEDTEATRTEYTYDTMYLLASAAADTSGGLSLTADYTYTDDLLTAIGTPSTTYSFFYGDFAQRSSVKIGTRTLASYAYTDDQNRRLDNLTYGNGDSVSYTYDDYGRVLSEIFEDGDTVAYRYDNTGALATVTDSETGIKTTYYYDLTDRLMKYVESGSGYSHSVGYEYDTVNNLTKLVETINGIQHTTGYTYDDDNRLTSVNNDGITESYTYDAYGRITQKVTTNGSATILTETYTYKANDSGAPTGQVATLRTVAGDYDITYTYTYDGNGNILSVSDGTNTTTYVYDSANQLIRENDQAAGKTWIWFYDGAGNILSRLEFAYTTGVLGTILDTANYTYGDSAWGDLLTSYDGKSITYDAIGNPLSNGTWTYIWQHGRELASMSNGTATWAYTYDANGMRKSRSNGAATYSYIYNGDKLSQMTVGSNTLYFTYDIGGSPMSVTYGGTTYYYGLNLQGDVIAILDASGTAVVTYTYDAWGNILSTTGTMANTLGTLNPLRYRSYVYDTETGLYYLQSRYYNPEIGRFINADNYPTTGQGLTGNNMFAYCGNNPVSRKDDGGEFWHLVVGGVVGGIIGAISSAASGGDVVDVLIGAAAGAIGGVLAASGAGVVAQALGSCAISMASNAASQVNHIMKDETGETEFNVGDMLFDGAVGLATGAWGGNGASYGNSGGITQAGKQLFKRGFFDPQARSYYAKVAHRMGGEYVFKPLLESLGKNAVGSVVITGKNILASKGISISSWIS